MRKLLAALALTAIAAPGMTRDRQAVPPATDAGKPESCIQIRQIQETRVHGDQVIDFFMSGGKVYRNTLPNACAGLGFEERFTYATSLGQLCSVDIIHVLYNTPVAQLGAGCGLGQFQPVTLTR